MYHGPLSKGQRIRVTTTHGWYDTTYSRCDPVSGRDVIEADNGEEITLPEGTILDLLPEAAEPEPAKPTCRFELWNRQTGELEECGADAPDILDEKGQVDFTGLCTEHAAFVRDSTRGPFTRARKGTGKHPADKTPADWLRAAKKAYGVPITFTMGRPSDAGKPVHVTAAERAEILAWRPRWTFDAAGRVVPVASEPAADRPAEPELTVEAVTTAARRLAETPDRFKGTGLSPMLWRASWRVRDGLPITEGLVNALLPAVRKRPDLYRPLFAA